METLTLLRLLALYVILTSLERLTGSGALRAAVNAFGVAMPLVMIVIFAVRNVRLQLPRGLLVAYGLLAAGLLLSVLVSGLADPADLIKFLLAPLFAFLGYSASAVGRHDAQLQLRLRQVGAVLLLPVVFALALSLSGTAVEPLGIFANRNNAALYLVVLSNLLFLMGASVGVVVLTLTVAALLFTTLGVVVAVALGLVVSLSLRRYLPAYLAVALLVAFLVLGPLPLPIGERLARLGEGVAAVSSLGLWTELAHLSYADLYLITGQNTDLSLFFRIKHWEDLLLVWTSSGFSPLLFGLGVGSSPLHTEIGLVPHNDYLRFLIEAGPLAFLGFAGITVWCLRSIGRSPRLISTAAVAVYFFTENLVSNFAAMTLYYWFAGYWARHAWQFDAQAQQSAAATLEPPRRSADAASPGRWAGSA